MIHTHAHCTCSSRSQLGQEVGEWYKQLGLVYGSLETNNLIIYILQSEWSDTPMDHPFL
jgi:hypothetical protein